MCVLLGAPYICVPHFLFQWLCLSLPLPLLSLAIFSLAKPPGVPGRVHLACAHAPPYSGMLESQRGKGGGAISFCLWTSGLCWPTFSPNNTYAPLKMLHLLVFGCGPTIFARRSVGTVFLLKRSKENASMKVDLLRLVSAACFAPFFC